MDWIQLLEDRVQWRAVVSTVVNLWFPHKERNLLTK